MIHQLRTYEIFDATAEQFNDRFDRHASRIMRRHSFRIIAMWETRYKERLEFIYLLEWLSASEMESAWRAFMSDPEWIEIRAATTAASGRLVGAIEDRVLRHVPYSPLLQPSS